MSEVTVPKRIHIVPLGYEADRIIEPVIQYEADRAIFLEPPADQEGIDRPAYHSRVRDEIKAAGIETETIKCDIFNLYESLGTIAELANDFRGHNLYVNLATGSKVTAIGGMIACMATGATPYYVRAKNYAGGNEEPVASKTESIEPLPRYHIEEPDPQHISILNYLDENQRVKKRSLINYGDAKELPFYTLYEADEVDNPDRGYYRRLNNQIIEPLEERGFIDVTAHSKYQYVTITEVGRNHLRAFRYLL